MTALISHPIRNLKGTIQVPGDKSISHRALMLSSQVPGTTRIYGLLEGEDVLNTARALQAMGVQCERRKKSEWRVEGVGVGGLKEPSNILDMGNSGTGTRLMMGLLAPYPFTSFFSGDASLSDRPMGRVITPLQQMGVTFTSRAGNRLPIAMSGSSSLKPIHYTLPVASAQVKSAILLAGLGIDGVTTVIEPEPTRDHTENMLAYLGFDLERTQGAEGLAISIAGKQSPPKLNREIHVPSDPSSAAFLVIAALITKDSHITIPNICINPLRIGLYVTLQEMGANISFDNVREVAGEKVADLSVDYSQLKSVTIPASRAPSMIDEYPILAVAAAFAEGETVMEGIAELKVKESNRLQAIIDGLTACGVITRSDDDILYVTGNPGSVRGGGTVRTHFDHRIAMSFLVLGMASEQPVIVDDGAAIATSFPNFVDCCNGLGASIRPHQAPKPRRRMVIAIDGPAASGKGTLGRKLAKYLGLQYLDTGSLYRAVGLKLVEAEQSPEDKEAATQAAKSITLEDMSTPKLRQEDVGQAASIISSYPEVREILLEFQRNVAKSESGAVLDGRDIGTVVCPDADYKFYLTASLDARARRRHRELQGQGIEVVYESVLEDLRERDERDAQRPIAPMKPAADATIIDTSTMDANSVFEKLRAMLG